MTFGNEEKICFLGNSQTREAGGSNGLTVKEKKFGPKDQAFKSDSGKSVLSDLQDSVNIGLQ